MGLLPRSTFLIAASAACNTVLSSELSSRETKACRPPSWRKPWLGKYCATRSLSPRSESTAKRRDSAAFADNPTARKNASSNFRDFMRPTSSCDSRDVTDQRGNDSRRLLDDQVLD